MLLDKTVIIKFINLHKMFIYTYIYVYIYIKF